MDAAVRDFGGRGVSYRFPTENIFSGRATRDPKVLACAREAQFGTETGAIMAAPIAGAARGAALIMSRVAEADSAGAAFRTATAEAFHIIDRAPFAGKMALRQSMLRAVAEGDPALRVAAFGKARNLSTGMSAAHIVGGLGSAAVSFKPDPQRTPLGTAVEVTFVAVNVAVGARQAALAMRAGRGLRDATLAMNAGALATTTRTVAQATASEIRDALAFTVAGTELYYKEH